jgi:hypothetical protein
MSLMGYSVAWGKLIHEKKLKSKVSCQIPFNGNCTYLLSLNWYFNTSDRLLNPLKGYYITYHKS